MFKLLNRIAWIVSIFMGFTISFYIVWFLYLKIGDYELILLIIVNIVLALIFKLLFLSKNLIKQRLQFFANSLLKISEKEQKTISIKEKQNLQDENISDFEENKVKELKNFQETKFEYSSKEKTKKTPSKIKLFLSENLLAKLGSIFVFLGVLFLLSLVYNKIGPVAKIIIGFIIGFITYFVGVFLAKKGLKNEANILLGVGILINYLVILSGRHLLGDDGYLSTGTTFIFLILNTIFAVLTGLIYKSKILLISSFVFAYLNPLLVGGSSNNPYTILGYCLIISFGAFFISHKQKDIILLILGFLLGNFLILISPISNSIHWLSVLVSLNLFNLIAIISSINFKNKYKIILEFIFGGVFFALGIFAIFYQNYLFEVRELTIAIISSIIFLIFSYILSKKSSHLYSLGTAGGVLTLAPLIAITLIKIPWIGEYRFDENFIYIPILGVIIFAILNWITPFINKNIIIPEKGKNITNFFIGSIFGAMFLGFNIYLFGEKYFPGLLEGIAFLSLAIIYFIQAFLFIQKYGINKVKKEENLKNIFYNLSGISISFFSLAIVFIFSNYPEIISAVWLFEASLLFYFYSKTKSIKIYLIAIVLFIIGIFKLGFLIDLVNKGDYQFLVSFFVIAISLVLNIKFLDKNKDDDKTIVHHIFHIIGIGILALLLIKIIPSQGYGWSVLGISIFIFITSFIYSYFNSKFLKGFFLLSFVGFTIFQLSILDSIFLKLEQKDLEYLKILQYLISFILGVSIFFWRKLNKEKFLNTPLLAVFGIYLFVITSSYIYDIFSNIFAITIYWGILSSIFLIYGIQKNIIKYRTIGLYIIILTALKIFLFDIWYSIDDAVIRVVALIGVGVLFIIISTLYSKRYGNNLASEFKLKNLKEK